MTSPLPNLSNISSQLEYRAEDSHGSSLYMEGCELESLAKQYGTPLFVYSKQHIVDSLNIYKQGLDGHLYGIYYSVKVNSNLHLLSVLHRLGAKFDVVSKGELQRVLQAGGRVEDCVFAGVGKTEEELLFALNNSIGCINVESHSELKRLNKLAQSINKVAPISLRINPNIDAKTHPYISTGLHQNKFGIVAEEAYELYQWADQQAHLQIKGVSCHIGSQLLDLSPLLQAAERVVEFAKSLKTIGIMVEHLDFGGGIGISYHKDGNAKIAPDAWQKYFTELKKIVPNDIAIHIEPGRSIVGNAGVLLTQIQYLKNQGKRSFAIVDAAMNDIIRPALYQAEHEVIALQMMHAKETNRKSYNVVGPVCETADFLSRNTSLSVNESDYLAILSAGAYCFCMSSNYNSRLKAAEILVEGGQARLVRQRETFEQMIKAELVDDNDSSFLE